MFELRLFENGATGMIARCDVCGEQVKADYANVLWDAPLNADGLRRLVCDYWKAYARCPHLGFVTVTAHARVLPGGCRGRGWIPLSSFSRGYVCSTGSMTGFDTRGKVK